jgi:hypothetical protein
VDEELEYLSHKSVIKRCNGCTHWEFWELKIQLEIYNLGNVLFILNGSSI